MRKIVSAILYLALLVSCLTPIKPVHAAADNIIMGEIKLFPYGKAPTGWLYCAGQTLSIAQFEALFQLIGTTYGGNGIDQFALPDLRVSEPVDGVGYYIASTGVFPTMNGYSVEPILGEVRLFAFQFTPGGWQRTMNNSGGMQILPINQNQALFSLYGTNFGGDGKTNFALPYFEPIRSVTSNIYYYAALTGIFPSEGRGTGYEVMGEIRLFPLNPNLPPGYTAEGQNLSIAQNTALFSIIGTNFGGDGKSTFALPNFSGHNPAFHDASTFPYVMYHIQGNGIFPVIDYDHPAPTAYSDLYTVSSNAPLMADAEHGVLKNDIHADTVLVRTAPAHGTLTLNPDGSFLYTPGSDFAGADSFTYKAYNHYGGSMVATVRLAEPEVTVTFDSNGGSSAAPQIVPVNYPAAKPADPVKSGYTFDGWYADAGLAAAYDFSAPVTADMTLYAKWTVSAVITAAVEKAVMEETQASVDAAKLLVDHMSGSPDKDKLLDRLATVQVKINNADIHIEDIAKLINEGTFEQKDINRDGVFDEKDIRIMLQRISPLIHRQ